MPRLFIGFKIEDEDGHNLIATITNSIKDLPNNIRWTFDGNFHITSHFMPNCDKKLIPNLELAMCDAIDNQDERIIAIEQIGLFPQYGSTLCAAFVVPNKLVMGVYGSLQTHLERLAIPVEKRNYTPHITLARGIPKDNKFDSISVDYNIKLNSLVLYESRPLRSGSYYEALSVVNLP
jgi:2'-5' RNA ligase